LNARGLSIPALQGEEEVSTTIIIIITIIPYGIIYEKRRSFKCAILIPFSVVCERWELKFMMKKVNEASDLARFVVREFFNLEYLMLIVDKLELLKESPFKYPREKLGKDVYGNPVLSLEVTGDVRMLYSVDRKIVQFSFGRLGRIRTFTVGIKLVISLSQHLPELF
jgi:hypothetical protein